MPGDKLKIFRLTNRRTSGLGPVRGGSLKKLKGLILAQNERWRRGLGMQVEREP